VAAQESGNKDLTISVNLSGKHFRSKRFGRADKTILVETEINPGCLKLELTESAGDGKRRKRHCDDEANPRTRHPAFN
jgi:EAL domain-containing protein (putative c-di-GMP-specific phosphodiesterase class I)